MKEIKYPEEIKREHWEYLLGKMEQPLVSIGEIALHWKCSKSTARRELKRKHIPVFYIGRNIAVYASTLKKFCEGTYSIAEIPESTAGIPESEGS